MIGQEIAQYRILEKLGEGGMGVVYKAEDTRLRRTVALKFLAPWSVSDADARERFLREARLAAALAHPNVCTIYEIGETDGQTFLAMAFLEGRDLAAVIREGPLDLDRALSIAAQVAEGLAEAHSKDIVHRDIKPGNIFIAGRDRAVILDFGLAQLVSGAMKLTREGTYLGTCSYMSPEQTTGDEVDARTDVWALGCVLYEMLAGRPAFRGHFEQAIVYSILNEEPDPLETASPELRRVLEKCLSKELKERYRDASEALGELRRLQGSGLNRDSAPPERARRPTAIAILPFENSGDDAEDEFFSDGVSEDIISAVSKIEGLRVTPRASAFHFKGDPSTIREIAGKLNVDCVLTGSVRRAGKRLRITAELIEATRETQIWSERYDRVLDDIFDIQDEISAAIAGALKKKLAETGAVAGRARRAPDVQAYRLYLHGRLHMGKLSESNLRLGCSYFEKALAIDPSYPQPHAGLADAYSNLGIVGFDRPADVMEKARREALKALELDDAVAEAHTSLGIVRCWYDRDYRGAEQAYRRAIELKPDDPAARVWLGQLLANAGRASEGVEELLAAVALDPLSSNVKRALCCVLCFNRDFEGALVQGRQALEIEAYNFPTRWHMATAHYFLGQPEEALQTLEPALALAPDDPVTLGFTGIYSAAAGREPQAREIVDKLLGIRAKRYASATPIGWVLAALGDFDPAFEWLNRAFDERDGLLATLQHYPWVNESFRREPRYIELTRRLGVAVAPPGGASGVAVQGEL